jgi:phospholipase/carboxylesterase
VQTEIEIITALANNRLFRIQKFGQNPSSKILLLLHGWTGDELSMRIFGKDLHTRYTQLTPRGNFPTIRGGYGWVDYHPGKELTYSEFEISANQLLNDIEELCKIYHLATDQLNLIGFSHGAALAYTIFNIAPSKINKIACLAGFMPKNFPSFSNPFSLLGKTIFIAHGANDELVPVHMAEEACRKMESAGAEVIFCKDPVGHKVGGRCQKSLVRYFLE